MINKKFPNYEKAIIKERVVRPREAGLNRAARRKEAVYAFRSARNAENNKIRNENRITKKQNKVVAKKAKAARGDRFGWGNKVKA